MKVKLAYGQAHLEVEFPDHHTTVIEPAFHPGLLDERAAVVAALGTPVAAKPLREWVRPDSRVCIAFSDITRPTPNERIIPWLLDHLSFLPRQNITLLNQLGTHRPNTRAELEKMLTSEVVRNYRIINHEAENEAELVALGVTGEGVPAMLNRHLVEADVRIVTGFIEPHFFAGFSGGPKGIMPGTAGLRTVMSNHRAANIAQPNATFGITEGNPLWEELRDIALRAGPSFLLNVTLNTHRQITGVFAGDLVLAHRVGTEFVRSSAMRRVDCDYDLVVTTNSGYPLDMNLYQAVKGLSAGARIVKPGGKLILVAECAEGVPAGSPLEQLLRSASSPEALLESLEQSTVTRPEQWQAQILAQVLRRCEVQIHSSIPESALKQIHLAACPDVEREVAATTAASGVQPRIAVLPYGPLTVPYRAAL